MRRLLWTSAICAALLWGLWSPAGAQITTPPLVGQSQYGALLNTHQDSAVNTALTVNIAGAAGTRIHVYSVTAACSAGNADLNIDDGATTIWHTASNSIAAVAIQYLFPVPLTLTTGAAGAVTLGSCGAGNTGHISVQADRW